MVKRVLLVVVVIVFFVGSPVMGIRAASELLEVEGVYEGSPLVVICKGLVFGEQYFVVVEGYENISILGNGGDHQLLWIDVDVGLSVDQFFVVLYDYQGYVLDSVVVQVAVEDVVFGSFDALFNGITPLMLAILVIAIVAGVYWAVFWVISSTASPLGYGSRFGSKKKFRSRPRPEPIPLPDPVCPGCQVKISQGDKFCQSCGLRLTDQQNCLVCKQLFAKKRVITCPECKNHVCKSCFGNMKEVGYAVCSYCEAPLEKGASRKSNGYEVSEKVKRG